MLDKDTPEVGVNKRAPKLRRSCETCRGSKGRCLPSDDDSSRCQKYFPHTICNTRDRCLMFGRCLKEGKACVFLEPKPRPKRAKNSRM